MKARKLPKAVEVHAICNDSTCSAHATSGHEVNHAPCANCLTRAQRRDVKRRRRHDAWACCRPTRSHGQDPFSREFVVRRRDLGKHAHAAQRGAIDHATGTNAWSQDPSMTRAVRRRLEALAG